MSTRPNTVLFYGSSRNIIVLIELSVMETLKKIKNMPIPKDYFDKAESK